jgi:hypothetical protein
VSETPTPEQYNKFKGFLTTVGQIIIDTVTVGSEVSNKEAERRLAICKACPLLGTDIIFGDNICSVCYCHMPTKVKYKSSKCADEASPKWIECYEESV